MIVYRAGNGIKHGILCAIRRSVQGHTIEVMRLGPAPLGAVTQRSAHLLLPLLRDRSVLQIGELLIGF